MQTFIIVYRYTKPGDKAAGPVQQYRINARDLRQAWELAREFGAYQGMQVMDVVLA